MFGEPATNQRVRGVRRPGDGGSDLTEMDRHAQLDAKLRFNADVSVGRTFHSVNAQCTRVTSALCAACTKCRLCLSGAKADSSRNCGSRRLTVSLDSTEGGQGKTSFNSDFGEIALRLKRAQLRLETNAYACARREGDNLAATDVLDGTPEEAEGIGEADRIPIRKSVRVKPARQP